MVILMTVAACYGIAQLALLSWGTRTVRGSSLLMAIATGCYGCGMLALVLQLTYTRLVHTVTGRSLYGVVETASYTVDPVIEELVKVLPLLAVVIVARRFRRQWGYVDYLLMGAAVGAGFSLAEALLRFSGRASQAIPDSHGGFVVLMSLSPPQVNGLWTTLTRWLPPPVDTLDLFGGAGTGLNYHLVWTALAGLGLGIVMRRRGRLRLLGLIPLGYAMFDHAATNYSIANPGTHGAGKLVLSAMEAFRQALPGLVLLALVGATVLDVLALRRVRADHPDLLLTAERTGRSRLLALARLAAIAPPWTPVATVRFTQARRAVWYELADSPPNHRTALYGAVAGVAAQLDRAGDRERWGAAWAAVGGRRLVSAGVLRHWRSVVWLILLAPAVLFLVVGAVPATAGLQKVMASAVVFPVLAIAGGLGTVFVIWQLIRCLRRLPSDLRQPWGQAGVRTLFRIATGLGAAVIGVALVGRWLTGAAGSDRVVTNFHILDALSNVAVAAAVALFLAALIFFPPFALVGLAEGGAIIVLTEAAATSAAVATGAVVLGEVGILLSEASESGGTGTSSGAQTPKAQTPKPDGGNLDPDTRAAVQQKLPKEWGPGRANSKKVGTRWQDPDNQGNGVRVDQGDPHAQQPSQRVDHVIVRHNGKVIGPDGKPISGRIRDDWQSHIPLDEWLKWGHWWGP